MAKIPNVMRWKFSSMLIFLFACRCNPDATGEKEAGWAALGRWEMAGKRQKLRSGEIKYVFLWYVKHQYFYSQIIFSPCLATTPSEDPEDWGDISRTFILCHFTIDFVLNVTRFFFVCPVIKRRVRKSIYGWNMEPFIIFTRRFLSMQTFLLNSPHSATSHSSMKYMLICLFKRVSQHDNLASLQFAASLSPGSGDIVHLSFLLRLKTHKIIHNTIWYRCANITGVSSMNRKEGKKNGKGRRFSSR